MPQSQRTRFTTCNLCEAMCGLKVTVNNNLPVRIEGDNDDPFSRGHICPKAPALLELYNDRDRLRSPRRKTRNGYQDISWDDALSETAERLFGVQSRHGNSAVAIYLGNPTVHNFGALMLGPLFLKTLRTKHRFSATSVDQLPHMFASYHMLGHQLLLPVPDVDRTQYFLMLGANPVASNGSLMTAPGIRGRLKELQQRGGKLVVVDPRRTETAELADDHHFIRPGTDAFFLASLLNTLLQHHQTQTAFPCQGLPELAKAVRSFVPEEISKVTGIEPEVVRQIANELSNEPRAVVYGRMGTTVQRFGALCQGLINAINIVTGHFDAVGGAMFPEPALDTRSDNLGLGVGKGSHNRWRSSVRGLPEFGGELPVSVLAEEIEAGEIRSLITMAGNPVLSTPSGHRLSSALTKLDFMVSIDIYQNETTGHADLILPPVTALERPHFDAVFHLLAVRNTAKFSDPVIERRAGTLDEEQIFAGLIKRLHKLRGTPKKRQALALAATNLGSTRLLDLGLRAGPYGLKQSITDGLSVKKLRNNPHGVDLGALKPCLSKHLGARTIHLLPELFKDDIVRLADRMATELENQSTPDSFQLIGRRHLRSNNSWMHNLPKLSAGKDRCTLLMNPEDAAPLGVKPNDEVTVQSRAGQVTVPVELSDQMMRRVVSLPHGFGHHRSSSALGIAEARPGVSLNDLTNNQVVDSLSGNAVLTGVPVTIRLAQSS